MPTRHIFPTIDLEQQLWKDGKLFVAGVDEAGRGPLAGPVTAGAAVIQDPSQVVSIVRDSKFMTASQRTLAAKLIKKNSTAWGVGIVSAEEIDTLGINIAVKKAMEMALKEIESRFQILLSHVLVDGIRTIPLQGFPAQKIKAGGNFHYSISAGSILAKVTRDEIMSEYALQFPEYGFEKHVGYGTKSHLVALEKFGISPIHRRSFKPVANLIERN